MYFQVIVFITNSCTRNRAQSQTFGTMCTYVYVCLYVCTHVRMYYVYTYVRMYAFMYVCIHIYTQIIYTGNETTNFNLAPPPPWCWCCVQRIVSLNRSGVEFYCIQTITFKKEMSIFCSVV